VHDHPEVEADPALSLAEVVRVAAERAPDHGLVAARRREGEEMRAASRRWLPAPPALYGSVVSDTPGSEDGYRQWDAGIELPLWWPGQRSPRRAAAAAAESAAREADAVHRLSIAGRVRAAVAELALARVRLELARTEERTAEALARRVTRAAELGELADREQLLARSATLERHTEELAALEGLRHAEADYVLLTGLTRFPADWTEEPCSDVPLEAHPEIALARSERERAESEVERIERARWGFPVVSIGTQHEREVRQEDYSDRLVAGVRIPIGRGDALSTGLVDARLEAAAARRDLELLERELRGRLLRSQHRLALATQRIAAAVEQAELTAEYLEKTERGFSLGEIDLATLILARARAHRAQGGRREAELLQRFHVAEYNQALGVVP
jgi:outer membrane protein TolC